ncbi:MAG: tryptophan 2,3-dioxygenase [Acidobacteria bacterium]|nr:tryptophan 2,3-dioxygenase [Acidobacteriota bacterium]
MDLTYSSYLRLERVLDAQTPQSEPVEHDELLFIIIHQVYELWFKLLLHEFDKAGQDLAADRVFEAIATFKRIRMVLKTLVGQIDVLETMTPRSFASFRARLGNASGFQSAQFRELEFLLGHKRREMLRHHEHDREAYARLERRFAEPSIVDRMYRFLAARGAAVPVELLARDVREPNGPDPRVQDELVRIYQAQPDAVILLEMMTDIDEGLQEWRYRHVKMVERTIGNKTGTGGSAGVEFLKTSLFKPVFHDLWAIRHRF